MRCISVADSNQVPSVSSQGLDLQEQNLHLQVASSNSNNIVDRQIDSSQEGKLTTYTDSRALECMYSSRVRVCLLTSKTQALRGLLAREAVKTTRLMWSYWCLSVRRTQKTLSSMLVRLRVVQSGGSPPQKRRPPSPKRENLRTTMSWHQSASSPTDAGSQQPTGSFIKPKAFSA